MSDHQAPKSPPRPQQLVNERTSDGRTKVPVVRDAAYSYLVPHLVPTGFVGEGPIPRVQIRLMRNERRTQALSVAADAGNERYLASDLNVMVELGAVELDLAQAAQLASSLFTMIDRLPVELQRAAGIHIADGPPTEDEGTANQGGGGGL